MECGESHLGELQDGGERSLWPCGTSEGKLKSLGFCFRWMGSGLATLTLVSKTRRLVFPGAPSFLQIYRTSKLTRVTCTVVCFRYPKTFIAGAQIMKIYLLMGFMFCRRAV